MTVRVSILPGIRRHLKREDGASLVEFAIVITLFLLVFFSLLDFGRLGFNWVMSEKAMQRAARIATVRPPICTNVPEFMAKAEGSSARFGTLCRVAGTCQAVATQSCVLGAATDFPQTGSTAGTDPCSTPVAVAALPKNPTQSDIDTRNAKLRRQAAQEIWCILQPILPEQARPNNVRVTYSYDPNLGFVGGPYVPIVEVGVVTAQNTGNIANSSPLMFTFITPIPGLAAIVGGGAMTNMPVGGSGLAQIPYPDLSVSLPGEDLNQGNDG